MPLRLTLQVAKSQGIPWVGGQCSSTLGRAGREPIKWDHLDVEKMIHKLIQGGKAHESNSIQ